MGRSSVPFLYCDTKEVFVWGTNRDRLVICLHQVEYYFSSSTQPLYDTVNIEDITRDQPTYEPFYSTVDDQPIYCVPDGEEEFTSDEDSEYLTPPEDEGTPPPLPPRVEVS